VYKWRKEQKLELKKIADECKGLGATIESLAPLYAAIYISTDPLTQEDMEAAKQ